MNDLICNSDDYNMILGQMQAILENSQKIYLSTKFNRKIVL
jgi:hypothetical protein